MRQLRESGLLVSRRVGKEVYYRAAENEQAQLLHRMIERTMEISCPEEESKAVAAAPHLPPLDAEVYEGGGTSEQIETIRAVHDYLTQHLSSRVTIDELSRMFLMNPSTMKRSSSPSTAARSPRTSASTACSTRQSCCSRATRTSRRSRARRYESQSKFSTEFHKAFGVLPTEYRRSQKK